MEGQPQEDQEEDRRRDGRSLPRRGEACEEKLTYCRIPMKN